ncbi:pimeloyl-ACP methyl ester carboxylesterase [Actinoplanes lutulentus]|uniref:Pimeloyl-ACP methyl ester carboxylesterase n=1 Tax=Actinoplanes lutulentus TaxID=1287878 RepID=A0A327ZIB7_9ACTN|nr:alpha/beta fold hydrolase [Actinoplanes lutulentus]MBB2947152.1 pimeloyl-ACP methyl ester carboxylesterase [Actinoplanes lutulentus]RAK36428.1 pimeloyl-ACP methyl ester carboxylesterase [Actinoplanes lutulentus]
MTPISGLRGSAQGSRISTTTDIWRCVITRAPIAPVTTGPRARREGHAQAGDGVIAYTVAGSGEPLLLIHGLGGTRRTWNRIIDDLSATHTVIAPDLPGHGDSDAPAGDYSLGALAAALRDLLVVLGHSSATVIGHSLGGGIALQFAYQFPERTERLVLISSGGLGPQLTPMLRAATLPGAQTVVAGLALMPEPFTRRALSVMSTVAPGFLARPDAYPVAEGLRRLTHTGQRRTFIRTARTVINWRGQSVSAIQHLRQLTDLPVFLAWGSDDRTIPPRHHRAVAELLTTPQLLEIDGAGHYPHETDAGTLLPALQGFLGSTSPFRYTESRWRHLLTTPR